jgi:hypothetical protein
MTIEKNCLSIKPIHLIMKLIQNIQARVMKFAAMELSPRGAGYQGGVRSARPL